MDITCDTSQKSCLNSAVLEYRTYSSIVQQEIESYINKNSRNETYLMDGSVLPSIKIFHEVVTSLF